MKRLSETKVQKNNKEHFTIIEEKSVIFGEGHFTVIAGPCALESEEIAIKTARAVEHIGAKVFRCSLFKPRISPYTYQGYGIDGVKLLQLLHIETNLLLETEVLSTDHLDTLAYEADILRIGSRNMDNYELLKAVGKTNKPIILKRNMSATLEEFLLAAEYIFEKTIRETLQVIFTREGFRVETARDGREALDLIDKEKYALVITELKMPGYGGMDLYGSVCKKYAYLKDKMIILTGDVFNEDVREFLNISGCPYVLKPFEPKKLIDIAVKLLS